MNATAIKYIRTSMLNLAYEERGSDDGEAIILLHGFPYAPRGYDEVAAILADKGYRVIVPYLRGYGPTRFLEPDTMRSGQQAALGQDLLDLMDGLAIPSAALVGYDWGGRAACIVAALWPERVRCLLSGGGYNIQDIAGTVQPRGPQAEYRLWYQYYFHTPRGEAGLAANRFTLCHLLWRLWSPTWPFDEQTYAQSAAAFENPDFVAVVIHSYRHRYGYVVGDPALEAIEERLSHRPPIQVPTISMCGIDDGVGPPPGIDPHVEKFSGFYERQLLAGVGHNFPQEAPQATVDALSKLLSRFN